MQHGQMQGESSMVMHGTTILCVRKGHQVCVGGDGQVTFQNMCLKGRAKKVRRLHEGKIIAGFAGTTADAMTLFDKLEGKLEAYGGNLRRAAVELAKDWRTDRYLRRLEAMLIAADAESTLLISGTGDVLEPDSGVMAIGSGGGFAMAAARAMMDREDLIAEEVVKRALTIAADMCIYTNHEITIEVIEEAV